MMMWPDTEITHPTYNDGTDVRIGDHVTDTNAGLTGRVSSLTTYGATMSVTSGAIAPGNPSSMHYFSHPADLVKVTP